MHAGDCIIFHSRQIVQQNALCQHNWNGREGVVTGRFDLLCPSNVFTVTDAPSLAFNVHIVSAQLRLRD